MNLSKTLLATALVVPVALTGCGGSSDGHNSGAGQQYQFSGAVQKGPLQPGSVVTIKELNQNLQPTGRSYTTQIEDYEGNYSVKERFSTPYTELVAHGYYFNELANHADEQMSMSAFVDMNATTQVNFNVATAAMKQSVMSQVQAGTEFNEAVDKATSDLMRLYSYDPKQWSGHINFYNTNLSNSGDTSTLLLVISTSTLKMATDNKLTLEQQIDEIGQVLLEPESVQFEEMKQALNTYNLALYKTDAYENTQKYFADNGLEFDIPHIDYFIDVDGDGVLPSKELPVFRYTSGVNIGSDEIGGLRPAGAGAVDYQGRPMEFEVTGEFQHGEIASIEHREDGVTIMYQLTDVNFEGDSFEDCVTVNTVKPAPANFPWKACVTLVKNN
ncbi:hypothetical protein EGL67_15315 [Vibrio parahaemolyticus]|uniref:hypothetical protein n=1 Tax=Vibrio parahaemolyticus TaxID=670 RepID=UPI00100F99E1|nr:hypothetical protein [Vibrio parahaemolyticus]RXP55910.1 hypothetical protein EGL73_17250 [Vibrio parahaemolyticus]RXP57788.1 hypothetical protein EGL72_16135 [Vibrio parahaemolyticus]RXP68786.1 hypothetical protein EGL71_15865 [Vibrio parahaemolyticus]RXP70888.1 hypothetical protein EGL70_17540 [Vibrio parahaemolyticus]RXP99336.1 hypothetical protein EGL68_05485 [Vibrio parahaemolyticus]